jgi:hypothetical protein
VAEHSIKGTAFQAVVDDLRRLRESGALTDAELRKALEPEDLPVLRAGVLPGSWYPIGSYRRMLELLVAKEGAPERDAYLRRRGSKACSRILEMGLYTHLQDAMRAVERRPTKWVEQVGRVMLTLSGTMFNFSRWELVAHEGRNGGEMLFSLYVSEATALPETTRVVLEGFIESLFTPFTQEKIAVRSRRPAPDAIVYEGSRSQLQ